MSALPGEPIPTEPIPTEPAPNVPAPAGATTETTAPAERTTETCTRTPKISVVIPTYRPGPHLQRVIESLGQQTMPTDEFEVVFVDDGSPDDTFARLTDITSTILPNARAYRIDHSGWPSRPRNVGVDHARGEYILFMDHDDWLYPDALASAYRFASRNGADILVIKESKTDSVWWGMDTLADGNVPNALDHGGIDRLQPMMPHKFYRRAMLRDNDIRFPEGERRLWEDVYINVAAYRHARVLSVLADTPVYRWHASDDNSSHTFDPARSDFWDRIEEVLAFIASTLDGENWREARESVTAWELGNRIIHRCVLLVSDPDAADDAVRQRGLDRARGLLAEYGTSTIVARLSRRQRAMLELILARDAERVAALHEAETSLSGSVSASALSWHDGVLGFETIATWASTVRGRPGFVRADDRVKWNVGAEVSSALPPELTDVTDDASDMTAQLAVRNREEYITWEIPHRAAPARFVADKRGGLALVQHGHAAVDLTAAASGRPLSRAVWDLRSRCQWLGLVRPGRLAYDGTPAPALHGDEPAVAYGNRTKGLSVDLGERLRSMVIDAKPRSGPAGPVGGFSAGLGTLSVSGTVSGPDGEDTLMTVTTLMAVPREATSDAMSPGDRGATLKELAATHRLTARIASGRDGPRLVGSARLEPGDYVLYAERDGEWHRTKRRLTVDADNQIFFDW
jgi:glycosyltransferase involved in cell wall biosynthesis